MIVDLKTLNTLKNEIEHLEEAAELVEVFQNCFDTYYDFRDFISKHAKSVFTDADKSRLLTRLDRYFNFDDSE